MDKISEFHNLQEVFLDDVAYTVVAREKGSSDRYIAIPSRYVPAGPDVGDESEVDVPDDEAVVLQLKDGEISVFKRSTVH